MLRYKVDLKVKAQLKLGEFNTPRISEKEVENYDGPSLGNLKSTKQENLPLHRHFGSNRQQKNKKSVTRARSDDCKNLKVSKSLPVKVGVECFSMTIQGTVVILS